MSSRCWRTPSFISSGLLFFAMLDTGSAPGAVLTTNIGIWNADGSGRVVIERDVESVMELRHKNVQMQQRDFSCGAASMATLFDYYLEDPVEEVDVIRELFEISKKRGTLERIVRQRGFTLFDLKLFADHRGYKTAAYRLEYDDLVGLGVPVLVPIIPNGYKHFVVFRGADDQHVYLADPSFGNLVQTVDEFKADWYNYINVALRVFRKDEKEPKEHPPPLVLSELDRIYVGHESARHTLNAPTPIRYYIPGEW